MQILPCFCKDFLPSLSARFELSSSNAPGWFVLKSSCSCAHPLTSRKLASEGDRCLVSACLSAFTLSPPHQPTPIGRCHFSTETVFSMITSEVLRWQTQWLLSPAPFLFHFYSSRSPLQRAPLMTEAETAPPSP